MTKASGSSNPPAAPVDDGLPWIDAGVALERYLRGDRYSFVDARDEKEWRGATDALPGAKRLGPNDAEETMPLLPRGKTIVTYCTSPDASASARAARLLRDRGYPDVCVLRGGLAAWRRAGGPTEPR